MVSRRSSTKQLDIIRQVRDLLAAARVRWWLFGGWAVDFHAGEVTREHGDIEFYIWQADADRVSDVLVANGFVPRQIPFPDEAIEFRKDEELVCAVFLTRTSGGDIVIPGRWAHWPWPETAFGGPPAAIGDLEAPVVTAEALLERILAYSTYAPGAPALRERDVDVVERLRAAIARQSVDDW